MLMKWPTGLLILYQNAMMIYNEPAFVWTFLGINNYSMAFFPGHSRRKNQRHDAIPAPSAPAAPNNMLSALDIVFC
jgi:hypothetical protein